jgi:hypothetical protein
MRIRVAESVMQKAGAFGLHAHDPKLAQLLKRMTRLSAIASGNFNQHRRRYGAFILTVRDNTLVDINCDYDGEICIECLGIGVDACGELCVCDY